MVTIHRQIDVGETSADPQGSPEMPSTAATPLQPEPAQARTRDFLSNDPAAAATFHRGGSYGLADVSIRVCADGQARLSGTEWSTRRSIEHTVSLGADVGRSVLDAFVEEAFLDIQLGDPGYGMPGQITVAIELSANGRRHSLSTWAGHRHAGFERLYQLARPLLDRFPASVREKLQV